MAKELRFDHLAAKVEIRSWSDDTLMAELRNPIRAKIGPGAYHLLLSEAIARLMVNMRKKQDK